MALVFYERVNQEFDYIEELPEEDLIYYPNELDELDELDELTEEG